MTRSLCLYIIVLAATLAGSLPAPVLANDRDLRATTVPAALCVKGGSNDVVWVWLNEREYAIRGTSSPAQGDADLRLHCALPLNSIDLGGTTNDNDVSSFTVFYRDGDGMVTNTFVAVTLYRTMLTAGTMQTTAVCSWNSNTSGNSSTGYTSAMVPCVHDVAPTGLYHFKVQMFPTVVSSPAIEASFVGIRVP